MTKTIPIERLLAGTQVYLRQIDWANMASGFNDFALVDAIEFDGHGYALTLDCGERTYVDAGMVVEFGGRGEPVLRSEADVSADEWEAKAEACEADTDKMLDRIAALHAETAAMNASALIAAE